MPEANKKQYQRLSDLVTQAMRLALDQKDVAIADILSRALEMSLTRNAGGRDFLERREMSDDVNKALDDLILLKKAAKGKLQK
ncbi:MAG: hypothetical protein JNM12_03975 [Alphaproteobacteria bacterium]|jgi:hypothetical protein|nr:hypothetical protein [Alphaproteobacteria bacterium]MCC7037337.1 hypothetical protein [Alphaproteobacteria bacterium]